MLTDRSGPADASDELDVTVIVPVLDGAKTLPNLLRGLASQVGAPDRREILIVDNGSTDGSQDIVLATPDVTLLHAARRGVSAARNVGLRAARGRIIACIDADAQPSRRWLAQLVAAFDDPQTRLVAGGLASMPARTGPQRFASRHGFNDIDTARIDGRVPFVNGRNLGVRRDVALAVGGWSEDMLRAEDIDFSMRIIDTFGGDIVLVPDAVILHHERETDEELRQQAIGYGYGMALVYERYPDRLPWGWRQRRALVRRTISWSALELAERTRVAVGRGDPLELEFLRYRRRWHIWYWRGFFETRRGRGLPP